MLIRQQYTVLFAHILLSWNSFTRKHFYTEALWHTVAGTFTCKYFYMAGVYFARVFFTYTHALSQGCLWSHMLLHRDNFTRRHLRTEERNASLHTNTFTERWVYTEQFYTETKNKQRCFYKGMHVHEGFLATGIFAQTYYWIVSCGGHAYGAKSSARICKIKVSPQLLMVETHVVGKGWPRTNPHCNFTSMYDDRHFVRTGCVSWTSIHAALPLEEKKLETIKVVGVCKKLISTCVFTSATSHLHISTSRFQKKDFRLDLYIFRTTPAYGIYSFGSCVKENSVNLRLWIWICAWTPVSKIHVCIYTCIHKFHFVDV